MSKNAFCDFFYHFVKFEIFHKKLTIFNFSRQSTAFSRWFHGDPRQVTAHHGTFTSEKINWVNHHKFFHRKIISTAVSRHIHGTFKAQFKNFLSNSKFFHGTSTALSRHNKKIFYEIHNFSTAVSRHIHGTFTEHYKNFPAVWQKMQERMRVE